MNTRRIEVEIKKYHIVSFDIFDTLLKRDVYKPADVFELVKREYCRRFGKISDFKRIRISAEKIAREKSEYQEVTLDEIYDEINLPDKNTLKSLELEIEAKVLHCNYNLKPIFDQCIEQGKDVYAVSDMYLPKDFLDSILQREGFVGLKSIIISADYRRTKKSGDLFKKFIEEYKLNSKDVLHIGDSRYADYIGARKSGINAIHIPRYAHNTLYLSKPDEKANFDKKTLYAYINSHIRECDNRDEQLGYEVLGPILYAYCTWIHEYFEGLDTKDKHLWFAARDMYLFKNAYELLYNERTAFDYMYISRKSLRPILTISTDDISESGNVFPRGECTVRDIVKRMGYSINDLGKKVDLDFIIKPRKLSEYSDVVEALSSESILSNERRLAENGMWYLSKYGFTKDSIVLADVGWHGTTQYILQKILDAKKTDKKIFGLYLGCLDSTDERIGRDNYRAFAFDEYSDIEFAKGILLFESLILAPHGSTLKYQKTVESIEPVLGEPENISLFLKRVQGGAIKFVRDFKDSAISANVRLDSSLSTEAFCKLAMEPKNEELNTIGQLDYDDFGIGKMASPKPLGSYILHPKQLSYDLKHSPWRIGFLYKLFKIRLPYAKIYSLARRKQGKQT